MTNTAFTTNYQAPATKMEFRSIDADSVSAAAHVAVDQRWKAELLNPPARVVHYFERDLLPQVGLFGTAADSTWRATVIRLFEEAEQISPNHIDERLFNPQKAPGTWSPQDAVLEATHLSRDGVVLFGLEKDVSSVGSMAELGFVATYSLLKGRKTITFIKDAEKSLDSDSLRARSLILDDARYIQSRIPSYFLLTQNLTEAVQAAFADQESFLKTMASPVASQVTRELLPRRDVQETISISGSSKDGDSLERLRLKYALKQRQIPFWDTHTENWTPKSYGTKELPHKDHTLVNTVLITDEHSFGALKDVGLAVFRAVSSGTYAVISLPEASVPKTDYARGRALVVAHWDQMSTEFPWLSHYVRFVNGADEMAAACVSIVDAQREKAQFNAASSVSL